MQALGIQQGPSHMEVMYNDVTGPCLVEVGSRCHGGEGTWVPVAEECLGYSQLDTNLNAFLRPDRFDALPFEPGTYKMRVEKEREGREEEREREGRELWRGGVRLEICHVYACATCLNGVADHVFITTPLTWSHLHSPPYIYPSPTANLLIHPSILSQRRTSSAARRSW